MPWMTTQLASSSRTEYTEKGRIAQHTSDFVLIEPETRSLDEMLVCMHNTNKIVNISAIQRDAVHICFYIEMW